MENCFYKFHEAREKAKEGDELYLKIKLKNSAEIETRIKVDTKNTDVFALSWEQYDSDRWQIIPDKNEMVSFSKIIEGIDNQCLKTVSANSITFKAAIEIAKRSAENRDILYADLLDWVNEFSGLDHKTLLPHNIDGAQRHFKHLIGKINTVLNPKNPDAPDYKHRRTSSPE